jgi:hypothetical protein
MSEAGARNAGADAWVELVRDPHHTRHARHDAMVRELLPPPAGAALDVGWCLPLEALLDIKTQAALGVLASQLQTQTHPCRKSDGAGWIRPTLAT